MKLDEILNNIPTLGPVRLKYNLTDIEAAYSCFCKIADKMLQNRGKSYQADYKAEVLEIIKWLYQIPCKLDPHKGIMLCGETGRGKTFLFKVLKEFIRIDEMMIAFNGKRVPLNIEMHNAYEISADYAKDGYEAIERYAKIPVLLIDDVGNEQMTQNFGNKESVISRIVDLREADGMLTFGTSNIARFNAIYDDRTISRMNSLFSILILKNEKDYRKTK